MSAINCEQENHILDQSNARPMTHKIQTTEMNRSIKKTNASKSHGLKTSLDKSSRKAFGNVSNVLRSGSQNSVGVKHQMKMKASIKESELTNLKSDENESMATEVETDSNPFSDEIEEMHPKEEELLMDSITSDLFTIDEQLVLDMGFDSDMEECLLDNKKSFDFNFL